MPRTAYKGCSIEGCDSEHWGRGWCHKHYQRWYKRGDPLKVRPRFWASQEACSIEGCEVRVKAKGYCERHYQHWWRYGTPTTRPIFVVCRIEGCSSVPRSRTAELCELHYYRHRRNGHFDLLPSRRIEHPSYRTAHARVAMDRGKAEQHFCSDCGERAHHWSFAWRRVPDEGWLWGLENGCHLAYTGDASDYDPRCRKCARRYDSDFARQGWMMRAEQTNQLERNHMTEGEQHTHEETVKDEHTNEDGKVTQETTEKTEAETNGEDE